MYGSGSPNPAAGPVCGLTKPILNGIAADVEGGALVAALVAAADGDAAVGVAAVGAAVLAPGVAVWAAVGAAVGLPVEHAARNATVIAA